MDVALPLLGCYALLELVMRGRIFRFAARELLRLFVLAELFAMTLVRKVAPPRFDLVGSCHMCGECCKQIVHDPPRFVKRSFLLDGLVLYHRLVHNFVAVGRGPDGQVIFSCNYLRTDGRCGIYRHRPFLCRNYPLRPFFTATAVLPVCGYQVAPRAVSRMRGKKFLPIVNPGVTVHHPTRAHKGEDQPDDYEWLDDS